MSVFFEVQKISVSFKDVLVLQDLSFSLEKGETLAVIGPNGAGKTVLLKTLLGSIPYKGKIIWHHKPLFGYVPQRFEINRTTPLSVEELFLLNQRNGSFWITKKKYEEEAKRNLVHVGVGGLWKKRLSLLSRGQLQRVLIAYALVGNPNIIFFDEPTASIDVEGEVAIHNLLRHLSKELGITLVIVTHDLNIAYKFADKVLCVNQKMFCSGTPKEIMTAAQLGALYGSDQRFMHLHNQEAAL